MIFQRQHSGYLVRGTFPSGRSVSIRVRKEEGLNSSPRGGAYCTEWVAKFGDHRGRGTTRTQAVEALARRMQQHNDRLTITFEEN